MKYPNREPEGHYLHSLWNSVVKDVPILSMIKHLALGYALKPLLCL